MRPKEHDFRSMRTDVAYKTRCLGFPVFLFVSSGYRLWAAIECSNTFLICGGEMGPSWRARHAFLSSCFIFVMTSHFTPHSLCLSPSLSFLSIQATRGPTPRQQVMACGYCARWADWQNHEIFQKPAIRLQCDHRATSSSRVLVDLKRLSEFDPAQFGLSKEIRRVGHLLSRFPARECKDSRKLLGRLGTTQLKRPGHLQNSVDKPMGYDMPRFDF